MSRLKKFFHRKSDASSPSSPVSDYEHEDSVYRRPDFRHSLYEDASYGDAPDIGTSPLKGNRRSASRPSSQYDQSTYGGNHDGLDSQRSPTHGRPSNDFHQQHGEDEIGQTVRLLSRTSLTEQKPPPVYRSAPSTGDLKARRRGASMSQNHQPQGVDEEPSTGDFKARRRGASMSQDQQPHRMDEEPKATYSRPGASEILEKAGYNSVDTEVQRTMAPAVTHETVHQHVHNIREERITREVHTHDVFHRILPIVDVEVLPARHFKQEAGKLVEMKPHEVPGRSKHWVIAETLSKGENHNPPPRDFTARTFAGKEGDMKKYITSEGVEKTEQTWVHPPELETGARATGQTVPIAL